MRGFHSLLFIVALLDLCTTTRGLVRLSRGKSAFFTSSGFSFVLWDRFAENIKRNALIQNADAVGGARGGDTKILRNLEESLKLDLSIESRGFLNNILEYGKARMARRAVGVLSKMPAYKQIPREEHYTACIWACEQSDQYELAVSVYEEMRSKDIKCTVKTYEALVSCAEKTGHWQDATMHLDKMYEEGLRGTMNIFNSCLWAADKGENPDLALSLLQRMEAEGVARNANTYAAATYACEKIGASETALHVLDLMRAEGIDVDTPIYRAAMWSCVKGGDYTSALSLFDEIQTRGLQKDDGCYDAAIWACEQAGNSQRSLMLLRLMKLEGHKRSKISFDGALTALAKAGDWEACIDTFSWMERDTPAVDKSHVTYKVIIDALDAANKPDLVLEYYLLALRDGFFVPWIKGTRTCDLRGMSLPLAKVALRNVLESMRSGKLTVFTLVMAVADVTCEEEIGTCVGEPEFNIFAFEAHIKNGYPPIDGVLVAKRRFNQDSLLLELVIERENLLKWTSMRCDEDGCWVNY